MATTTDIQAAVASLGDFWSARAKPVQPISAEQAKATRAALDAKFRAGETVMNRDARGCFTGAVKVATFGGAAPIPAHNARKVEAVEPAFKMAAE